MSQLDEIEEGILDLLRRDGRMSNRDIAASLRVGEGAVRERLRRLIQSDTMRVVAVADFQAVGFDLILFIGVEVLGRSVGDVANDIAALPEVLSCNIVMGRHDIEVIAAVDNRQSIRDLIIRRIAKTQGIHRISTGIVIETLKYQVDVRGGNPRGFLETFHVPDSTPKALTSFDSTNLEILKCLWKDARETNQKIAATIGTSEGTVRGRIKKMIDGGLIRIQAITNIEVHARPLLALVGVDVILGQAHTVALTLARMRESGVVVVLTGRHDVMLLLFAEDARHLQQLVFEQIRSIRGVLHTEVSRPIEHIKFDYRFGRISPIGHM
jgi:Lrp/AsnC family transcriptional regulator for asnA, asnC and gidA